MRFRVGLLAFAFFAVLFAASAASLPLSTSAQPLVTADPVCVQLVSRAEAAAAELCGDVLSNTACYGNGIASAAFQVNATGEFAQPGDIVPLSDIQSITTARLDPLVGSWGIAVVNAQTTVPEPAGHVTFVLFGDATLDNPSADMLGVTVSTRLDDPACVDTPNSGLVIHAPKESQAQMKINGADITLGSCAFVTAVDQGDMAFAIIEGTGVVTVGDVTRIVTPGYQVRIPLGGGTDGLQVNGVPSELEAYDFDAIALAPLFLAGCSDGAPLPTMTVPVSTMTIPTASATASVGCTRTDWTFTYVVPFGDTLSRIASSLGISVQELAQGNSITNINVLIEGQVLCVPRVVPPFVFRTRTPTRVPTSTGTITATFTATSTGTITATFTPSNTFTPSQTLTPSNTFTPTETLTPTNTFTATETLTATNTNTLEPTATLTSVPVP